MSLGHVSLTSTRATRHLGRQQCHAETSHLLSFARLNTLSLIICRYRKLSCGPERASCGWVKVINGVARTRLMTAVTCARALFGSHLTCKVLDTATSFLQNKVIFLFLVTRWTFCSKFVCTAIWDSFFPFNRVRIRMPIV